MRLDKSDYRRQVRNLSYGGHLQPLITAAMKSAFAPAILLIGLAVMTSGCGQKGALYLPDNEDSSALLESSSTQADSKDNDLLSPSLTQQILDNPNDY